jgi:ADP-ribosyl-[dinitrogen reductase] hydrolase
MHRQDLRDRALASYLGFAVGDALGATTEFMRPGEIQAKFHVHKEIIGGGWLHLKPGQVTDDTQLCLALGEALLEAGGMDERVVADRFVRWMSSKPADIGHTIRQALSRYKLFGCCQADYSDYANSNGALMRNLPVIIATLHTPELLTDWSTRQGLITHNNREAEDGMLMVSQLTQQVMLHSQATPLKSLTSQWIAQFPRFDYTHYKRSVDGYIVDTLKTVLFFFFNTPDFESCLIGVVNAGGDADTNGALAGMLAAPFYGLDSIPQRWLKKMDRTIIADITRQTRQLIDRFWKGI